MVVQIAVSHVVNFSVNFFWYFLVSLLYLACSCVWCHSAVTEEM